MKKIICVILGMVLVFLAGCRNANSVDSDTMESISQNGGSSDVEYRIYAEHDCLETLASSSTPDSPSPIIFRDASELDYSYSSRTKIVNEKADAKRELVLAGRTVSVNYKRSFTNALSASAQEDLRALGNFDEYYTEGTDGSTTIQFRQSDNELVFYSETSQRNVPGSLSEQEAKALADAFLEEKYGKEFMTEYTDCEIVQTTNSHNKTITVGYTKYICGYKTTDRVLVTYNMTGELKAFNATTKGLFASVEDRITEEKITNAENYLLERIPSSVNVYEKTLVLNSDGQCYLRVYATENDAETTDFPVVEEYYINID